MNRLYYGKIGSGKTYLVMFQEIIPALREGRKVITNIDGLDLPAIRNYIGRDVDIKIIKSHKWYRENMWCEHKDNGTEEGEYLLSPAMSAGALYVIDECHDIWNAREFKNTNKDFITLLSYNRHFHIDLIFISQNVKMAEVNITRTANDSYQVKNMGFLHGMFARSYVVNRRQTPFDKDVISQYKGTYDKSIFTLYKSGTDASKTQKSGTYFSSPKVMAIAVFVVVCLFVLVKQGNPIKKFANGGKKNVSVTGGLNMVGRGVVPVAKVALSPVLEEKGPVGSEVKKLEAVVVSGESKVLEVAVCKREVGSYVLYEGDKVLIQKKIIGPCVPSESPEIKNKKDSVDLASIVSND